MDVADEEIDEALVDAYVPPKASFRRRERTRSTRRPGRCCRPSLVLLAGQGTLYAEAWEELRELAEPPEVPVAATMNAKGVFPEDHPLSLGTARAACTGTATASTDADLIFGVGASFSANTYSYPLPSAQ